MMHRLCVCVCVSRVCLCTVRVCCGSDSAWSLTRILICFCYFPPDSLFTFLPCPLFEQEVQFHSSGEAHTYSFFFFFFAHTFSTHTSASTHAAFNEKRASTSALNLYAITPPLGFALRSVWTHLKSVQFTFVHIFVFLICMCALLPVDHDYIISMHFIKLYKVKGNAPVFFDCCYGITHNWTSWEPQKTKKQHFSFNTSFTWQGVTKICFIFIPFVYISVNEIWRRQVKSLSQAKKNKSSKEKASDRTGTQKQEVYRVVLDSWTE